MTVKSVKIFKNKIIKNKKGNLIKYLNKHNKYFKSFGEVYFSEIKFNQTKGWNYHSKNTCLITTPYGSVVFKIFNPKTKKMLTVKINKKDNKTIRIPPGFWFSFRSLSKISIVTNLMNNVHSEKESKKLDFINKIKIK